MYFFAVFIFLFCLALAIFLVEGPVVSGLVFSRILPVAGHARGSAGFSCGGATAIQGHRALRFCAPVVTRAYCSDSAGARDFGISHRDQSSVTGRNARFHTDFSPQPIP